MPDLSFHWLTVEPLSVIVEASLASNHNANDDPKAAGVHSTVPDAPTVKPLPVGAPHVYVVPAGTMLGVVGVTTNATPLHVTVLIVLINGKGFTVITTVKLLPTQPLLVGCKVYVTDNEPFVVFVNVPTIVETEPVNNVLVTPDADPTALTRLYIVPTGTTPFDAPGTRLIEPPVHTTWVIPEMIARGLSVTTTLNCAPTQLPVLGVTK